MAPGADAVAGGPEVVTPDLESVYRSHFASLVSLARLILGSSESAEEVVQEAFVRTIARRVEPDDPLRYVRRAVVNLCRSRFRRRVIVLRCPEMAPSAELSAVDALRRDEVLRAVGGLPERQREVVALRYFAGLSTAETADAMSIADGTVKAHLHRALASLRIDLGEDDHDR